MYLLTIVFTIVCVNQCIDSALPLRRAEAEPQTGLTLFDQRQSGSYNIHLNIKDVAIIAVGEGEGSGSDIDTFGPDYYADYDLSDFTVKPIQGLIGFDAVTSTTSPSIIHSEPEEEVGSSGASDLNTGEEALTSTAEVVLITSSTPKPLSTASATPNKTQSVVILNQSTLTSASSGIVVTTPTPSAEALPVKIDPAVTTEVEKISQAAIHVASASADKKTQSAHPDQIPVQIVLGEPQLRRQAALLQNRFKVKATPARRRITPPDGAFYENRDISHPKAEAHAKPVRRRQCPNGNCNRRPSGM